MADISDLIVGSKIIIFILISGLSLKFFVKQLWPSFSPSNYIFKKGAKGPSYASRDILDILTLGFWIYLGVSGFYIITYSLDLFSDITKLTFMGLLSFYFFVAGVIFFVIREIEDSRLNSKIEEIKQKPSKLTDKSNSNLLKYLLFCFVLLLSFISLAISIRFIDLSYRLAEGMLLTQQGIIPQAQPYTLYARPPVLCNNSALNVTILNRGDNSMLYFGYRIGKYNISYTQNVTIIPPHNNVSVILDLTNQTGGWFFPKDRASIADYFEGGHMVYIFTDAGTEPFTCK